YQQIKKDFHRIQAPIRLIGAWMRWPPRPDAHRGVILARFSGSRWSGPSQLFPLRPRGPCAQKKPADGVFPSRTILTAALMRGTATVSSIRAPFAASKPRPRFSPPATRTIFAIG